VRAAVVKALGRSLALSAAVMIPGLLLLFNGAQVPGMLWLFGGSFGMVAWTYHKPWRLGLVSCLIPPVAAALGYLVQLVLFSNAAPSFVLVLGAVIIGVGVGWYRGESHQLYENDGSIFAQRTIAYLGIWIAAYAITQLMALLASNVWLVRSGLLTGAFSTAMLVVVSIIILQKRNALAKASAFVLAGMFLLAHPAAITPAAAQSSSGEVEVVDILRDIAGKVRNVSIDAEVGRTVLGLEMTGNATVVPLNSPQVQRISNDVATATYVTDASSSIVVTLRRLESPEAAAPQMSELQGFPSQMVRWIQFRGGSYLFGMNIKDEKPPSADALAITSKDRFQISVRASVTVQPKPPSPSRDDEGLGAAITGGAMEGLGEALGLVFVPMLPIPIAAEYYADLDPQAFASPDRRAPPPPDSVDTRSRDDRDASAWSGDSTDSPSFVGIDPDDVAAGSAAVAAILIAAGIAANIAQAIAAAIAAAAQSGVEMTSEQVSSAIAEGLARSGPTATAGAAAGNDWAPGPPPKPPPIYDKDGTPFATNDQGQYWAPDDRGNWRWLNPAEARAASAALGAEEAARAGERADFARDTQAAIDRSQAEARTRDDAERQRIAAERAQPDGEPTPDLLGDPLMAVPGLDNTGLGWTINFVKDFVGGSASDLVTLIRDTPGALTNAVASAASAAGAALSNPENWTIAGETAIETIKDIGGVYLGDADRTQKVAENVGKGAEFVGKVGTHLVEAAAKDPAGSAVAVGKAVLGAENWEKAIDPNVPVTERFGRAVWGTIDTGTLVLGAGSTLMKGADKIADLVRVGDTAGDLSKGVRIAGATSEAADAVKSADAIADAAKAADKAHDAAGAAKSADAVGDAAKVADKADGAVDAAKAADATGDTAKGAKAADELAPGRRELLPEGRKGGPNTERYGVPDMATDPEGYVRELPSGALVDRNLANGSGYAGHQIDDMARMAKEEGVVVGARSTNVDSMRHIRDGNAVPKPLTIKSKTIQDADIYLGARAEDKGLVGYFRPNKPDPSDVPPHMWEKVNQRYTDRLTEYNKHRDDITKMITEGKIVERDGKLHSVLRKAEGTSEIKPFAGDIDAVYFRDAKTGKLIPPGERYDELKRAWMGGQDSPGYWARSGAAGQHGAETNLVADLTRGLKEGTPEYEKALKKAHELHADLAANHSSGKEVILEMHPDGHLRRGVRFSEDAPLPDLTRAN